ncbi:flagellar biosynthetic protein FliO [Marinicellulosiphila megalodicopiae]|uniref:flagellar biosynthetic protein FliO n=1 Tax=Marinicellulosiphila megalodicopiae TaxID=2724896 RepID=UPI003BAF9D54
MNSENLVDPMQIILSLGLVIGLIFACAWVMRRTNGIKGFQTNLMTVKSVLALGAKEKIMIVQVGKEQLLLSVCTGHISLLKTLDEPITFNERAPSEFSEKILQMIQGGKVAKQQNENNKKHDTGNASFTSVDD